MAEQRGGDLGANEEQLASIQQKLERFADTLDPNERTLFTRLLDRDILKAVLQGRLGINPAEEDDGFWAKWAERQY